MVSAFGNWIFTAQPWPDVVYPACNVLVTDSEVSEVFLKESVLITKKFFSSLMQASGAFIKDRPSRIWMGWLDQRYGNHLYRKMRSISWARPIFFGGAHHERESREVEWHRNPYGIRTYEGGAVAPNCTWLHWHNVNDVFFFFRIPQKSKVKVY